MNTLRSLAQSRLVASVVFFALIFGSVAAIAMSVADVIERKQALTESEQLLDQMRARVARGSNNAAESAMVGSPFLEGPTLTVAGATLLQRVAGAITRAGGTLQSSQIDVEGAASRSGLVGLVVNCEVDQPKLQDLLYDLEAGVPFLYLDQLDIAAPATTTVTLTVPMRMRLVMNVSAQWRGGPP